MACMQEIAQSHTTRKKKNTYVIDVCRSTTSPLFEFAKSTHVVVTTKNGTSVQTPGPFKDLTAFPNPGAFEMILNYPQLLPINKKLAETVIEYLDKDTGATVCYLFPTTIHLCDGYKDSYLAHLNHATRQDLDHQMKIRHAMIMRVLGHQK